MLPIAALTTFHAGFIGGWLLTWLRRAGVAGVTLALHLAWSPAAIAQVSGSENEALRVFLDCARCDQNFMRIEITYVDFMRDRQDAQVHVLVTTQATGAGTEYTLAFIGLDEFADTDLTLRYAASQTDTADEVRRALARRLELGLAPFIAGTPVADELAITRIEAADQASVMAQPEDDPWKFWVFRASANANLDTEQSQTFLSTSGAFSADRTTDAWKVRLNSRGNYSRDVFDFGDSDRFTNTTNDWNATMLVVRSLGDHWGVGVGGSPALDRMQRGLRGDRKPRSNSSRSQRARSAMGSAACSTTEEGSSVPRI